MNSVKKVRSIIDVLWVLCIIEIIAELIAGISLFSTDNVLLGVLSLIIIIPTFASTFILTALLEVLSEIVENTYYTRTHTADSVDNTYDIYEKTNYYLSVLCNRINPTIPIEHPQGE